MKSLIDRAPYRPVRPMYGLGSALCFIAIKIFFYASQKSLRLTYENTMKAIYKRCALWFVKYGNKNLKKILISQYKSSLYSRYYTETHNEQRGPSLWLSAWTIQLRRNVVAVTSRWPQCVRFDQPGIRTLELPYR